jgi:DHA1 family multidrug resistance protein-like MFS transporter
MSILFNESPFGLLISRLTGRNVTPYPEERPSFLLLEHFSTSKKSDVEQQASTRSSSSSTTVGEHNTDSLHSEYPSLYHFDTAKEAAQEIDSASTVVAPTTGHIDDVLVDWYASDDPANPQNWSTLAKCAVTAVICCYTFAVYAGSSIYTPAEQNIMEIFNVSVPVASLGLALYVLGYGMGPMLFSPLSEVPSIGRTVPYAVTFAIYVALCIPTALVNNIAGLLVLRFLQGFFGSPCLATAPASFQDMFPMLKLPYSIAIWTSFSFCGPALGPVLSGYSVAAMGWRWSMWELLWMAAPCFIVMFFFLPETLAANILLRRAQRLRKLTADYRYKSQSEISRGETQLSVIVFDALIKPIQICIMDPAVLFVNVYTSIVYGIYYSFFEAFPLVYGQIYHFNIGEVSTTFVCIFVACLIGVATYVSYLYFILIPDVMKNGLPAQEHRLKPALIAVFLPTIGLFLFGWTSREDIHWIVSILGITIYALGVFIM